MNFHSAYSAYFLLFFLVVTGFSQPADTWNHAYREEFLTSLPVLMQNSHFAKLSKKAAASDNDAPLISRMEYLQPDGDNWTRTMTNYYSYDNQGRIVQLDVSPGSVWKYTYSESGKKVTQTRILKDTSDNYTYKNNIEYFLCNDTPVISRFQLCNSYDCFLPSNIVLPVDSTISTDSAWDTLTASWIQQSFFRHIYTYAENHIYLQGTHRLYDMETVFETKIRFDYSLNENNLPERIVRYENDSLIFDTQYRYENMTLKSLSEYSDARCSESHRTFCYSPGGRIDTILSRNYAGPQSILSGCIMEPVEERRWMLSKYVFIYDDSVQSTTQRNRLSNVTPPFSVTMNKRNIIVSSCRNVFINKISLFNMQGKLLYRWVPDGHQSGQRYSLPAHIDHSISLLQIHTNDGVFAATITNLSAMK